MLVQIIQKMLNVRYDSKYMAGARIQALIIEKIGKSIDTPEKYGFKLSNCYP